MRKIVEHGEYHDTYSIFKHGALAEYQNIGFTTKMVYSISQINRRQPCNIKPLGKDLHKLLLPNPYLHTASLNTCHCFNQHHIPNNMKGFWKCEHRILSHWVQYQV
jgi:hypothetical protein